MVTEPLPLSFKKKKGKRGRFVCAELEMLRIREKFLELRIYYNPDLK
jgi:hypothetical protein